VITLLCILLAFAVILFSIPWVKEKKPSPRKPVHVDLPEIRAAVHEAGHAVAAWCCTIVTRVKVASVGKGGDGRVGFELFLLGSPDARWCQLVIALAGPAAEAMVYKKGRSRESNLDLTAALQHAEAIGSAPPPWAAQRGPTFDFDRLYYPRPSEQARRNLEEGYRMAKCILQKSEHRMYAVTSALLACGSVSEKELSMILGSRTGMRLLLVFGPKFVLPRKAS
jgi:hypothetical protein